MGKNDQKIRDARFRDRPRRGPTPPRDSDPGEAPRPSASKKGASSASPPWWKTGDVVIPVVLALGVGLAGWQFYRARHPVAEPAPTPAPAQALPVAADAGRTGGADAVVAAPPEVPAGNPRTGHPTPSLDGSPVEARVPQPTSPDPVRGPFGLPQATAGLDGTGTLRADIETSMGEFSCALLEHEAPVTVANFVGLARGRRPFWDPVAGAWASRPFYDGSVFHRVIPGFMIQGGDQLRSGTGDTGYTIPDENVRPHDAAGLLCMANRGPDTGSSQFFITAAARDHLDGSYSIFGRCTPTSLVDRIAAVPRGRSDRPDAPVFIRHVRVHRG